MFSTHLTEVERNAILAGVRDGVQEAYCGGFGVVLSVITADRKLLFFRRSKNTAGDWGTYDCTVVESFNYEKDVEHGQPSVMRNALRGLFEEAGLEDRTGDIQRMIRFFGVVCRSHFYEWALYGTLDLSGTGYTASQFAERYATATRRKGSLWTLRHQHDTLGESFGLAHDAFEFVEYVAVDFNVRDVLRFITQRSMSEYSFINAILTLRSVLNVSQDTIARELLTLRRGGD
ncbi:MAG: hypothetical protein KIS68_03695 [Bauldia sp.]|nr:hypothetical protein [Bauldia sp.]